MAVDPLANDYPSWSPYNYTLNNPINAIDPDGRSPLGILQSWMGQIFAGSKMKSKPQSPIKTAGVGAAVLTKSPAGKNSMGALAVGAAVIMKAGSDLLLNIGYNLAISETPETASDNEGNSDPFVGPVNGDVNVVDPDRNVIPVEAGEQASGTADGEWIQVKDAEGNPSGTRIEMVVDIQNKKAQKQKNTWP